MVKKEAKRYWLMKSEPETYSIDQMKKDQKTCWEGVRNYQARNFMMKDMSLGDYVLFYHSNAEPTGIAGLCNVHSAAEADKTQFEKKSDFYDPKSTKENPRWKCVEIKFVEKFSQILTLESLKKDPVLQDMQLLKRGQRLSVQPVSETEFHHILKSAKKLGGS
ncbi:MAG: EVE domain-containing protein [Pseudobdellovibrionaceae bacterium]